MLAPEGLVLLQYWDDGEPPGYIDDLVATFRAHNPEMSHRLVDERGAGELIEAHFGERELEAFRACAVPAMRSDYFRYCAVLALGGIYADVGFRCVAPLRSLLAGVEGGMLVHRDPPGYVLTGFFLFPAPGHPLLRLALDVATVNIERRASEMVQMVTGPWIFSSLFLLHRLGSLEAHRDEVAASGIGCLEAPLRREAAAVAPTAAGRRGLEPMVSPLLESVGEYARLEGAFEGVRVAPYEHATGWIRESEQPLPYKQGDSYWINWQKQGRTIFR